MRTISKNGIYICLEGPKGVGKSTLMRRLSIRLAAAGIRFSTVSPTQVPAWETLYERLWKSCVNLREEDWFQELMFAGRSNAAAQQADWNAELILGDRSIVTSYAVRWRKYNDDEKETVRRVDALEPLIPAPDHVILLSAPYAVLVPRMAERKKVEGQKDECEERIVETARAYDEIRHSAAITRLANTTWHDVDGSRSAGEVLEDVWEIISGIWCKEGPSPGNEQIFIV